jgi:uncharacterized protein YndB with AHSA1/START domain
VNPCFHADEAAACVSNQVEIVEGSMPEGAKGRRAIGVENSLPARANAATRRQMLIGTAGVFGCLTLAFAEVRPSGTGDISSACEVIHQEVVFKAVRNRVYEALTDAKQFNKVVLLSAAIQSGMAPAGKPVELSPEAGGAFSAFGGHITGRNVELVPNERIVQAWRAASWGPGQYSIARFEFTEQGSGTKLVFDHAGFPPGQGAHLAEGWKTNYWEPLEKYLAQG